MVDGAALEMLCPERDQEFESLALRQKNCKSYDLQFFFYAVFAAKQGEKIKNVLPCEFCPPVLPKSPLSENGVR